jgi:hypothetical protein
MSLKGKQKKFIRKHSKTMTVKAIASELSVNEVDVAAFIDKNGLKKIESTKELVKTESKKKYFKFTFSEWFSRYNYVLILLFYLVFSTYVNSIGNEFLSDDIYGIVDNTLIDDPKTAFLSFPPNLQNVIYYLIVKIFGKSPEAFRLFNNLIFHLGSVYATYFLVFILANAKIALLAASLFAVHPMIAEGVVWVSAGSYPRHTFFILSGLIFYVLSKTNKKYFFYSLALFVLALFSSEKAVVFPLLILAFSFSYKIPLPSKKYLAVILVPAAIIGLVFVTRLSSEESIL